ncbi:hypothetical protein E1B28_012089 [Marasmius oreades]|uniref:Uncharacterized protein n=1 Tax=Marasmius oreades TaxID=181124 RepID=A0A9P7RRS1_9AGAR|nr:uncharacterized protein E1B28_012089 [Marasmius oreades]KAG7088056.1 hypothetical protein E1B28_012089 [Marasmius oreades]
MRIHRSNAIELRKLVGMALPHHQICLNLYQDGGIHTTSETGHMGTPSDRSRLWKKMSAPNVQSDPYATILESFRTLAISEGLKKKSKAYQERRRAFLIEHVQDGFINQFGVNSSSLDNWKRLLDTVGIEGSEEFTSITMCKEALKGKYVNLIDLVDAANAGKALTAPNPFSSAKALSKYIRRTKKIFPKEKAKRNPLLRQFLIVVTGS